MHFLMIYIFSKERISPTKSTHGFGYQDDKDFFVGLQNFHEMTNAHQYSMKIRIWNFDKDDYGEANYDSVTIGSASEKYKLMASGFSTHPSWRVGVSTGCD